MTPFFFQADKKSSSTPARALWSPSQKLMESPCTKIIKERQSQIKARALLDKFIEISIREDPQKGRNQEKRVYF